MSHGCAPAPAGPSRAPAWPGLVLAAGGAIAFSAKAIVVKLACRHGVDAVTLTMWRMLFALPLFAALACGLCLLQFVLLCPRQAALVAPEVLWLSLLNAVFRTFAPVLRVMTAVERTGATATAQTGMIGPLATIALGVMILGEPFNGWIVAGTALILLGIALRARASSMSSKV